MAARCKGFFKKTGSLRLSLVKAGVVCQRSEIKKIELIVTSLEGFVELLETYREEEERKLDENKKTNTNREDEWEIEYQNDHIIMAEAKIRDAISLLQF